MDGDALTEDGGSVSFPTEEEKAAAIDLVRKKYMGQEIQPSSSPVLWDQEPQVVVITEGGVEKIVVMWPCEGPPPETMLSQPYFVVRLKRFDLTIDEAIIR